MTPSVGNYTEVDTPDTAESANFSTFQDGNLGMWVKSIRDVYIFRARHLISDLYK